MGELKQDSAHVNITLVPLGAELEDLRGKKFPCPLCADGLMILASKRGKPYCVCNPCVRTKIPSQERPGTTIENGVAPSVVQRQMRHSDSRITLQKYAHVIGDAQRRAADALAGRVLELTR